MSASARTDDAFRSGNSEKHGSGIIVLPDHPGVRPLPHLANEHEKSVRMILAQHGLLEVAEGFDPPKLSKIVLPKYLPALPSNDRECARRQEYNAAVHRKLQEIANDRFTTVLTERTRVFSSLYECAKRTAPTLALALYEACDMSSIVPGYSYYDGALAYSMYITDLRDRRMHKKDRDYYRAADTLQISNVLADGCLATEYAKKARA